MRHIYFSPHLDDAVLSAGGLIHDQAKAGQAVEIWTFMAGFPKDDESSEYARATVAGWGLSSGEEALRIRREEDKKAAALLGAKAVHYEFLDCVFRRNRMGQVIYKDVFAPPHPSEADLPAQVAQTMIAWLKPKDTVYCPLGVGNHIDHITVRKAAEMLRHQLVYVQDVPYSIRKPEDLAFKTANLREARKRVSKLGAEAWLAAIEIYVTQMPTLFGTVEKMREEVYSYWKTKKGIDLWKFE